MKFKIVIPSTKDWETGIETPEEELYSFENSAALLRWACNVAENLSYDYASNLAVNCYRNSVLVDSKNFADWLMLDPIEK